MMRCGLGLGSLRVGRAARKPPGSFDFFWGALVGFSIVLHCRSRSRAALDLRYPLGSGLLRRSISLLETRAGVRRLALRVGGE